MNERMRAAQEIKVNTIIFDGVLDEPVTLEDMLLLIKERGGAAFRDGKKGDLDNWGPVRTLVMIRSMIQAHALFVQNIQTKEGIRESFKTFAVTDGDAEKENMMRTLSEFLHSVFESSTNAKKAQTEGGVLLYADTQKLFAKGYEFFKACGFKDHDFYYALDSMVLSEDEKVLIDGFLESLGKQKIFG